MAANINVTGLTTEELSKAIADATVAATTAVAKATATASASLKLKADDASPNANGFKADRVVTEGYLQANYAKAHDYQFCLREISFKPDDQDLSAFSVQELASILDPNGCDLAMMPLVHFAKESETEGDEPSPISVDASKVVGRLKGLGLPIDVTIWFDSKNLNDCVSNKDFITELTDAGYSVGYFGGSDCACPQGNGNMQNGSIVLDNVQCGSKTEAGGGIQTFTIGDNSGACKIRWIKPQ
ncbi:hypothetical protein TW78_01495 [Vibrio coralliilyticus]|uniref:Uncharacterized protein n=1 Tax=Vibrio coralliilyticus TaxID=190893 RepID=A0A837G2S8_9VIBR|nr:hypothetical protein [Vibrio coralliilyticus]KJY79402.1 hypothetical protein TW78_01495 [Vibrio coralliilyticus]QOU30681.1 hypothetical protein TW71_003940 [Vibrio coralliilyticus]